MATFDSTLLRPFLNEGPTPGKSSFIDFINLVEGWKTKCKNLHWAAPKKNIHVYLDDFLSVLSDFQDSITEDYMGITGKLQPNVVKGVSCECTNALDFIEEVKTGTISFYDNLPKETIYKGITSETETFIHDIAKYTYLFKLCDIMAY